MKIYHLLRGKKFDACDNTLFQQLYIRHRNPSTNTSVAYTNQFTSVPSIAADLATKTGLFQYLKKYRLICNTPQENAGTLLLIN